MSKINNTTDYGTVTPATNDLLIGTDVSNTSNDANGETVTFTAQSIANLAGGGGGTAFIATADASNDATIDFTGFNASSYDAYLLVLSNVILATDTQSLLFRTSTDGGSTYDSGSTDYAWNSVYVAGNLGPTRTNSAGDTDIALNGGVLLGSDTNEYGVSGQIWVLGPHLTGYTAITWHVFLQSTAGAPGSVVGAGQRLSAADVDAVRLVSSSGNIESGTITFFGLVNA